MSTQAIFNTYSRQKITSLIKRKKSENISTIGVIESFFSKKRGYVFVMPKPRTPVVFQISGGMDSVNTAAILMEKYGLVLYPLFVRRGQSRVKREEASVDYFAKIFVKKYSKLFNEPFKLETRIPPLEMRDVIIKHSNDRVHSGGEKRRGIPMYASLLTSYAVEYAYYLELTKHVFVRNIFCAAVEADAIQMAHHSLTGLRGIMFDICTQTDDYRWQFTSPLIEREIGHYYGKEHLIEWGWKHGLPIHRTWSCYKKGILHCGECPGCGARRYAFEVSRVPDNTVYNNDYGRLGKIRMRASAIISQYLFQ